MDSLFQGWFNGVLAYLDVILVTGSSTEEHLVNPDKVLSKLSEALNLINPNVFLWHQKLSIDKNGLHPSNKKVEAIKEARTPTCMCY